MLQIQIMLGNSYPHGGVIVTVTALQVMCVLVLLLCGMAIVALKYGYMRAEWVLTYMQQRGWVLRQDSYFYKNGKRILFADLIEMSRRELKRYVKMREAEM